MSGPTATRDRPTLSVVVASYNSPEILQLCLASLCKQPAAEVIVADCSDADPTPALAARFPKVKFLYFNHRMSIPELRREGIRQSSGEIVALTESWMVPTPDWVAILIESHFGHPGDPVIGGAVDFPLAGQSASALQWADYFSEYGHHIPPARDGYTEQLTGPNCSYKRWALEQSKDLIERGCWEPVFHARLKHSGHRLRRAGRAVVHYCNSTGFGPLMRQRFHYGRWTAADRSSQGAVPQRLLRAAITPAVPWVMLWRLGKTVFPRKERRIPFLRAFGWLLLLYSSWSLGELCGYLFGRGSSRHVREAETEPCP